MIPSQPNFRRRVLSLSLHRTPHNLYTMDWSQDFCLACDNANPTDGPYCSEACRLSDTDKSTELENSHTTLYSQSHTSRQSDWMATTPNRTLGLYLAPAVNFSALRTTAPPTRTVSLPSSPQSAASGSYFASTSTSTNASSASRHHHSHSSSRKSLASSSSRSSLSSISTGSSSHGLSDQAIHQLRNYVNSFDHTRDVRRRLTLA